MRRLLAAALVWVSLSASGHEVDGLWEGRVVCGAAEHPLRLALTKEGGTAELPDRFVFDRIVGMKTTPTTLTFTVRDLRFTATVERSRISGSVEGRGSVATFAVERRPPVTAKSKLYLPAGKGPFPAVVLPRDASLVAERFAAAGVAAWTGDDDGALRKRSDIIASRIGSVSFGDVPARDFAFSVVVADAPVNVRNPVAPVLVLRLKGDCESGPSWTDRAIAWSLRQPKPQTALIEGRALYDEAALAARLADTTRALALLDRAIEEGFDDTAQIENDEDLAGLRDAAGFESIVYKSKMLELRCAPNAALTCWQDAVPRLEQAQIEFPRSGRAAFNLAVASQKSGNYAAAAPAFTEAAGLHYKSIASAYSAALSFGKSGDRTQMLRWLERALRYGFPVQTLLSDPEFAPLREDPEVKTLITRYGTNWPD